LERQALYLKNGRRIEAPELPGCRSVMDALRSGLSLRQTREERPK
jgi:hypothetical protein